MHPTCKVCGSESTVVACSSLGAMSLAYCKTCINNGAEPMFDWLATIDICGGPEHIHSEYARTALAWEDGTYVGWDRIVECYRANEERFRKEEEAFFEQQRMGTPRANS